MTHPPPGGEHAKAFDHVIRRYDSSTTPPLVTRVCVGGEKILVYGLGTVHTVPGARPTLARVGTASCAQLRVRASWA